MLLFYCVVGIEFNEVVLVLSVAVECTFESKTGEGAKSQRLRTSSSILSKKTFLQSGYSP